VESTGAIGAEFAVPAVAIPSNPGVNLARGKMNSWDKQKPREEFPARKRKTNARPSVHAGVHFSARVDCLHQAHRFFSVHLREARGNGWLVQVKKFNSAAAINFSHTSHARSAQAAGAIKKNG
jgi:hypothetical protein